MFYSHHSIADGNGRQKLAVTLRKLWRNQYFKTVATIGLILLLVIGFWFGLRATFNTKIFPLLSVTSGSMCIPYDGACDGWTHPFERTLHIGDVIIIQGVNPASLNANYPNSDIIVFQRPDLPANDPEAKIVHRIVSEKEVNGKLYFFTKGDGNGAPDTWPNPANTAVDYWAPDPSNLNSTYNGAISQDYVYGKLAMRIPWIGWITILAQKYFILPIIVVIIVLLVIIEFVLPLFKENRSQTEKSN
jgi:signal peptidase I